MSAARFSVSVEGREKLDAAMRYFHERSGKGAEECVRLAAAKLVTSLAARTPVAKKLKRNAAEILDDEAQKDTFVYHVLGRKGWDRHKAVAVWYALNPRVKRGRPKKAKGAFSAHMDAMLGLGDEKRVRGVVLVKPDWQKFGLANYYPAFYPKARGWSTASAAAKYSPHFYAGLAKQSWRWLCEDARLEDTISPPDGRGDPAKMLKARGKTYSVRWEVSGNRAMLVISNRLSYIREIVADAKIEDAVEKAANGVRGYAAHFFKDVERQVRA